jgi:uncharacterized protein YqgV (UPF0045/DUF77 family)
LSINAIGQQLNDSLLVGAWRVETVLKKPSNPHYRDLVDSFKGAMFRLYPDHTFTISTDDNSQDFAALRKMTKEKAWKFDAVTNTIKVGDAKDNYSTMKIKVKQVDGKMIFAMDESYQSIEVSVIMHHLPKMKL